MIVTQRAGIIKNIMALAFGILFKSLGAILGALFYYLSRQYFGDNEFSELALMLSYIALVTTIYKFGADQYILKSNDMESDILRNNGLFLILAPVSFLVVALILDVKQAVLVTSCASMKYYLDLNAIIREKKGQVLLAIVLKNVLVNLTMLLFLLIFDDIAGHTAILLFSFLISFLFFFRVNFFRFSFENIDIHLRFAIPIFGLFIFPFLTRGIDLILFENILSSEDLSDIAIIVKISGILILIGTASSAIFSVRMNNSNIWKFNIKVLLIVMIFSVLTFLVLTYYRLDIMTLLGIKNDIYYMPYIYLSFVIGLTGTTGYALVKLEKAFLLLLLDVIVFFLSIAVLYIYKSPVVFIKIQTILFLLRLALMHAVVFKLSY